jgi:phosphinothricin acetyltransferase
MSDEIIIRPADVNDVPGIMEIMNEAVLNTTAIYDYAPYSLESRIRWFEEKMEKNLPVYVAVIESKIAGFGTYIHFRDREGYKFTAEHSVYTHVDFRNRGVARLLLQKIIEVARQNGKHALIGGISADNLPSIRLHEKFGFVEVANLKQVGYKFDRWLDLKFFELIL